MSAITIEDVRETLLPLQTVLQVLGMTEPLDEVELDGPKGVHFQLDGNVWDTLTERQGDEEVPAKVIVGGVEVPLTKDALLEATSLCGLPKGYVQRTPVALITPQLDYWFSGGFDALESGKVFKLLKFGGTGAAFVRRSIRPFSNTQLAFEAVTGIRGKFGEDIEILADPKFSHSVRGTFLRLVVPGVPFEVESLHANGDEPDVWNVGVQVRNSLIGATPTSVEGYLFRWTCSNGAVNRRGGSASTWSRKSGGQGDEVFEWARGATTSALEDLEANTLPGVRALVGQSIAGDVADALRDVFGSYKIPSPLQVRITESMAGSDDLSMYGLMQAITSVANGTGLRPEHVDSLMAIGGDLGHTHTDRCKSCHRISVTA